MALKIKPEHVEALREAMDPFLNEDTFWVYRDNGYSAQRTLWDAFWAANKHTESFAGLVREIYTYANDDNLYSAFKQLARDKGLGAYL